MKMKSRTVLGVLSVVLLVVSLSSVFSVLVAGYTPGGDPHTSTPIIRVAGAPAINQTLGNQTTFGVFNLLYPNGVPVVLNNVEVYLRMCSSTCTLVIGTLTETAPGVITYSVPIVPSLTGAVNIIVPAGSLTDSYGRSFPRVDTVIGSYFDSTSGATAGNPAGSLSPGPWPGVVQQAQPVNEQPQANVTHFEIEFSILLLSLSAVGLLILPSRKV